MLLTKFKCMICGRVTDPQPEYGDIITGETVENDICDECKEAIKFVKKLMMQDGLKHYDDGSVET